MLNPLIKGEKKGVALIGVQRFIERVWERGEIVVDKDTPSVTERR